MSNKGGRIARVSPLDAPYSLDNSYDYLIPAELRGYAVPGAFVIIPFGGGNRRLIAVVLEITDVSEVPEEKLKPLLSLAGDTAALSEEMLGLCVFMKERFFCTIGDAVKTLLPPEALAGIDEYYVRAKSLPDEAVKSMSPGALAVFNLISRVGKASRDRIRAELGDSAARQLTELVERGYIKPELELSEANLRYEYVVSLKLDMEQSEAFIEKCRRKNAAKQAAVVEFLMGDGKAELKYLKSQTGASSQTLKALAAAEIIGLEKSDLYRTPYEGEAVPPDDNILSAEQETAAGTLTELYKSGEAKGALLFGVTGSGKTRVIKRMIDEVIADGRQVILLVPEISLTPQTVGLFRGYYGDRVAVIHSSLSAGERFDAWRRMKNGDIDVCIGTRSAVFAPFDRLGMIAIDEEQEHTYKSDMTPRYHARDIARFRCAHHKALMLLASATPSLDSYRKAETGVYTLVKLENRYGNAVLPQTIVADMREDSQAGNISPVGHVLRGEIEENLRRGEQTILFLNRRGYNHFLSCVMCGEVIMCPHCSVSLTLHKGRSRTGNEGTNGYLVCHYCGYRVPVPEKCPSCGSEHLKYQGWGTQKAEEELHSLFPAAKILRMDADTTQAKFSYDRILDSFRNHEADILLGTQMVAKGHDFPDVTLVGIMNADMALYLDDFHSSENAFSLFCQVIGRAGRSDTPGRAVIQTYSPDNPVLRLALEQNFEAFYQNEAALRKTLVFPPFCDIAAITLTGDVESEVATAAAGLGEYLKGRLAENYRDVAMIIFGPLEPYLYKLSDKYRLRFVLKCKNNQRTRDLLRELIELLNSKAYKMITASVDINPGSM